MKDTIRPRGGLVAFLSSIQARDPAARSKWEILLYPGVIALGLHRVSHWLWAGRLNVPARLINHVARFLTAIHIHPGAKIGRNFFIDHGFTVIGETAEIGNDVTIYQCVTLGGTNPAAGEGGRRHPTIRDGVVIGSGAQILGPIEVGEDARVGANSVVTRNVLPGSSVVGIPARPVPVDTSHHAPGFVAYGTPCGQDYDPSRARLARLGDEIVRLREDLAALKAAHGPRSKSKSA